ncbi:MAG: tRNA lysidine(34) synthetase TilS [Deltaproteobacteria bacterium]|nr:tRNA lysidine(34) synthetase TilS [Deltaproteobacteria bacterium]
MHPLEKEILATIRTECLIAPGEGVVTGVSAGPDSMALLHVLAGLAPVLGLRLIAVYVDHCLRPRETEQERLLVAGQARLLGADFATCRVDVREQAASLKISVEHAARDVRYDFFSQVAERFLAGRIAVAHTADDQAEEVLLRLIRGTGRTGLSGMKMMRDAKIIRPFLATPKEKLLAYLRERNIPFLVDSSNFDRDYLRNRIRLDLLPFLQQFNPNIAETLRQTAALLQDEERVLADLTETAWAEMAAVVQGNVEEVPPSVSLELAGFLALERGIRRRIAEKVFIALGSPPQFKKIEQILQVAATGETGARLHFAKGLRMKKGRDYLVFSYPGGKMAGRGDLDEE